MCWRTFHWIARLVLGSLFLYAGYLKLANPFLFEMAVDSYQLLPPAGVVLVARVLPWIEVALGMLLLKGWKLPYLASFTALLLGFFLLTMGLTYARGIEANCGCFGFNERISPLTLVRDTGLFLLAALLAAYGWSRRRGTGFLPPPTSESARSS